MKKIKKLFLGIGALWSTMIARVYANSMEMLTETTNEFITPGLYGPPSISPLEEVKLIKLPILAIIATIVGLNVILRKKFSEKKEVLNIVLIISSVVVTALAIIFIASLFG